MAGPAPGPAAPATPADGAAARSLLVSLAQLESGPADVGGTVVTLDVTRSGEVTLEARGWGTDGAVQGSAARPCPRMSPAEIAELDRLVREAQAVIDRQQYSTSSRPPPTANYSRSETYRFSSPARFPEVSVAGWADVPVELSRLGSELGRLRATCDR